MLGVPDHLLKELHAVEGQIRAAFAGVTRDGGIGWAESRAIDLYCYPHEIPEARKQGADSGWEQLVHDAGWDHEPGVGGFTFLDPIGYRHYLAPAMIRCAREGLGEFVAYALTVESDLRREQIALISDKQSRAIVRFLRFMITVRRAHNDEIYAQAWLDAYRSHWHTWDGWPNPID